MWENVSKFWENQQNYAKLCHLTVENNHKNTSRRCRLVVMILRIKQLVTTCKFVLINRQFYGIDAFFCSF